MSGSPKYSIAKLGAAASERLRQDVLERERQRAAAREMRAATRRKCRLATLRTAVLEKARACEAAALRQCAALEKARARHTADPLPDAARRLLAADDLSRLRALGREAETCEDIARMRDIGAEIAEIGRARRSADQDRRRVEELAAAQEQIERFQERVEGLQGDEVVAAWCSGPLRELAERVASWKGMVEDGDPRDVLRAEREAEAAVEAVIAEARERQLQEDRRAYLVQGLLGALSQDGFMVAPPELSGSGYDGEVVIRAVRTDGRRIDVSVPASGAVSYTVGGYERRMEVGHPSCDEAEAHLQRLHQTLAGEFDIAMGEIWWEGRGPRRERRGALELPTGGGRAARAQGRRP